MPDQPDQDPHEVLLLPSGGVVVDGEQMPYLLDEGVSIRRDYDTGLAFVTVTLIAKSAAVATAAYLEEQPKMTQSQARDLLARHNQRDQEPSA